MGSAEITDRFWAKVDRGEDSECWLWMAAKDERGYGVFHADGRRQRAHRWLLGQLRGAPLTGKQTGVEDACHRCDNPPCVNPAHLYVGTRKRNAADAVERSRLWQQQVTHCPKGHPYSGDNLYLKPSGARACRECRAAADRVAKERKKAKSKCRKGHPLVGDNILLCRNGARKCQICDRARNEARRPKH